MGSIEIEAFNQEDYDRLREIVGEFVRDTVNRKLGIRNEKQHRYDKAYMKMSQAFAELSYAERAKVGCVIVSPDGQIISQGYNGMPSGMDNCCEHEEDGKLVSNKEVLHAESNAITKCAKWGGRTDGATIYVTLSPCIDCGKLIIQAGIRRVVYGDAYRNTDGLKLLSKAGVETSLLSIM